MPSAFPFTAPPHTFREASPAVCRTVSSDSHGTSAKEVIRDHSPKVRHDEFSFADAAIRFTARALANKNTSSGSRTGSNLRFTAHPSHCNFPSSAYSVSSPHLYHSDFYRFHLSAMSLRILFAKLAGSACIRKTGHDAHLIRLKIFLRVLCIRSVFSFTGLA